LELSPDFLDYFQTLYPLLVHDKTLWCISAWNDNGIDKKIAREPSKNKTEYPKKFYFFIFQSSSSSY
jgi:alpha-1,3-mannosyl-glycoprotein beta-1,2-N-acetylglucosaminyltransferase